MIGKSERFLLYLLRFYKLYFFFYYIKNKDKTNLLTDIKGNKLPVGNSKEEKNIRKRNEWSKIIEKVLLLQKFGFETEVIL